MGPLTALRRSTALAAALSLVFVACDGSSPPTPASMTGSPSSVISGTVGQNVSVSVTVTGSDGNPYAGGVVSFTVSSGGGQVSPTSATTDQNGRASATWTLGQTTGTQQLTASLSPASTTFQADAAAGAPADIQAVSSFSGTYDPGEALSDATFEVEDQYGNKVSGASVSFSASDDGTVDPAQSSTDTQGRASTTWTLGPGNGTQTLTANVGSVSPATVQAEAYDPCLDVQTLPLGGAVTGSLSSESCETTVENQLRFLDWYAFSLSNASAVQFTVTSQFTRPSFNLWDTGGYMGGFIANDNDITYGAFLDINPLTVDGSFPAMTAETYRAGVYSVAGGVGSYQVLAAISSGQVTDCDDWLTTGLLTTNQALDGNECVITENRNGTQVQHHAERFYVYLRAGETLAISQTSDDFDTVLYVFQITSEGSQLFDWDDDGGEGFNSFLELEADATGYYRIYASTYADAPDGVGDYNLTMAPVPAGAPEQAPGPRLRSPIRPLDLRALPGTRGEVISGLTSAGGKKIR